MDKIFILMEEKGSYDDYERCCICASFDENLLKEMANKHNEKERKKRLTDQSFREVDEIPLVERN